MIVVAIIGVLVAISIPIFNSQLEKSRDAVSVANLRAAYAEAATQYLTGTAATDGATITGNAVTIKNVKFKGKTSDKYSGLANELPFGGSVTTTEPAEGSYDVTFTWDDKGTVTAAVNG